MILGSPVICCLYQIHNVFFFLTATLGTVLDHLNKEGIVGRDEKFMDKLKSHLSNGAELLKEVKSKYKLITYFKQLYIL